MTSSKEEEKKAKEAETLKSVAMMRLLNGQSKEEVGIALGIKPSIMIRYEVELQAKRQHKILTEAYLEGRKQLLPEVLHCGLNLIANSFKHAMSSGEPLSLRDAEIVSKIIANVDHIARLDAGEATHIVDVNRTIPATLKDMVAAFKQDPFIDTRLLLKEIDYTIKQEGNNNGNNDARSEAEAREDPPAPQG